MTLNPLHSAEDEAFRAEIRSFIAEALPEATQRNVAAGREPTRAERVHWQRTLNGRRWAVPHWPMEHGGQDWDAVRLYIFHEELIFGHTPDLIRFNTNLVGPVIAAFGSPELKAELLGRIANADVFFCQGFSEPNAGSDLASLRAHARRDGDDYVINGQKIWTSSAHYADWMFGLFRTDREAVKHRGISFLVLKMATPGITVRPIITLDGLHKVNEVFFDDVRVPARQLIGEENRGWSIAKFLLGNERLIGLRTGLLARYQLQRTRRIASQTASGTGTVADERWFREASMALEISLKAFEITTLRVLSDLRRGTLGVESDPRTSLLKLKGSELLQATHELTVSAAGPEALAYRYHALTGNGDPELDDEGWVATVMPQYFHSRVATILGGTSEVQRNIIAKVTLGL